MADDSGTKSIWAKIRGVVKTGGNVLTEEIKYFINPMHWGHSGRRIRHEVKQAFYKAQGKLTEEYDPPIKITQASEDLGVHITEQGKGKGRVIFKASRTLVGDIPYLSQEQLDQIKNNLPNVTIFREKNEVIIEVDVEKITNDIKDDPEHKGKSPEEIKQLVIGKIYDKVNENLKGLAKITGGEFKVHTDRKLLHGIAEKLYKEYNSQKEQQPSEAVVPKQSNTMESSEIVKAYQSKSSEALVSQKPSNTMRPSEFNMTNPNQFPFGKETISPTKMQSLENQVREWGSTFSNLEDVSGEAIKPLSTPNKEKEGKSRS